MVETEINLIAITEIKTRDMLRVMHASFEGLEIEGLEV